MIPLSINYSQIIITAIHPPIINVTTIASNSSSVLPNYNLVKYPLNDTFTTQNNTPLNVLTIS
jgi:hypothetical protein